jgi:hypothetical protein
MSDILRTDDGGCRGTQTCCEHRIIVVCRGGKILNDDLGEFVFRHTGSKSDSPGNFTDAAMDKLSDVFSKCSDSKFQYHFVRNNIIFYTALDRTHSNDCDVRRLEIPAYDGLQIHHDQ